MIQPILLRRYIRLARNNESRSSRRARSASGRSSYTAAAQTPSGEPRRAGKFLDLVVFVGLLIVVLVVIQMLIDKNREQIASSSEAAAQAHIPVITEIMPSNRSALIASDGESYDWFEITNAGSDDLSLKGFMIADSLEKLTRYVFGDVTLAPNQSVVVYCAGAEYSGQENFAPFRLKAAGESLYLLNTYGDVLNAVPYPALSPDTSWSLNMATNEWSQTEQYTPGFPNTQDGWAQYLASRRAESSDLLIWEVMSSNNITCTTQSGEYYDWVEIYNRGANAVNLAGYALSDSESDLRKYEFGDVTIQPGQYLLVYCAKEGYGVEGELIASFGINSLEETVVLSDPTGKILDSMHVERLEADTSYGRTAPDLFKVFTKPTPGYANTDDGYQEFRTNSSSASQGPLAISEVKTVGDETVTDGAGNMVPWVEIVNTSGAPMSLSGYSLTNNANHIGLFPLPDVTVAAGQKLLIFADGTGAQVEGEIHTNFKIKVSGGDTLILADSAGQIVDAVRIDRIPSDMSYGRLPGQNHFVYLQAPTPREENSGLSYLEKCDQPAFSHVMGNYVSAQDVTIHVPDNTVVRYTTDGSKPTASSAVYTEPIHVAGNTVLRAAAFRDGYVPSEVTTTTYFINEAFDLPLVSLSVDPYEMFDEQDGLYMRGPDQTYPYNGSNFMSNKELEAYIELLETDGSVGLSQGFGLRIFGAFSR